MNFLLILIISLFASFLIVNAQECTFVSNDKVIYLNKFTLPNNGSYYYISNTNKIYSFNVCQFSEMCLSLVQDPLSTICVSTINNKVVQTVSFGSLNTVKIGALNSTNETGAQLQLTGSSCSDNSGSPTNRKAFMNFICADVKQLEVISVEDPGSPVICQITLNILIPC